MMNYFDLMVRDLERMEGYQKLDPEIQEKLKGIAACILALKLAKVFFDVLSDMYKKGEFKKL